MSLPPGNIYLIYIKLASKRTNMNNVHGLADLVGKPGDGAVCMTYVRAMLLVVYIITVVTLSSFVVIVHFNQRDTSAHACFSSTAARIPRYRPAAVRVHVY